MARYRESVCRLCRRENTKLFLKGERCYTEKCAVDRRNYPPGEHGQGRIRITEYGRQLREKQKVKRTYGMFEKQFRRVFGEAARGKKATGEALLVLLERRLDNVIYRLGFGVSRNDARQLVRHSHVRVNGRKVDIPSFLVKAGDRIEVKEKSRKIARVTEALETVDRRGVPVWLELDKDNLVALVKQLPVREDITMPIDEQLIVELYSK